MSSSALRILITDPHLHGGGQVRYLTNLTRELVNRGHEVWVGCKAGSVLESLGADTGARVSNAFHFRRGLHVSLIRDDVSRLRKFIRDVQPDILHVNGSQDHWMVATANRLMGRPVTLVRTRHNTYPVVPHWPNRVLNRDWTDYQIIVCDFVRQTLADSPAFDGARMCAIHNGVDAQVFHRDDESRRSARREFGYEDDHSVVGIAARLVVDKGHRYLLEAVAQLLPAFPSLRLLVLGQGALESELRALSASLDIGPITTFAGYRDDMARCINAFDIGVQPSIDCDTSSFSLKEQMATGIPVIASDYGGLTEIVSDGVEGRVVPAGQSVPMADALRSLLTDLDSRAAMGIRGRERVMNEFTVQAFAEKTEAAYRRAIEVHDERSAH